MLIENFFESKGFDEKMDVSASNREFQTSVIIKQNSSKSGILSFLEKQEVNTPQRQEEQTTTQTPSRDYGGR